jgi:hypothetical protein
MWVGSSRDGCVYKGIGEDLVSGLDHIAGDPMMAKAYVMERAKVVKRQSPFKFSRWRSWRSAEDGRGPTAAGQVTNNWQGPCASGCAWQQS